MLEGLYSMLNMNIPTVPFENFAVWDAHRELAVFNRSRLEPKVPLENWHDLLEHEFEMKVLERDVLEWERLQISALAKQAPADPEHFMSWYVELLNVGPGQKDPLFDWLESTASREQMRWFIEQEVAGEAGFDDLAALTQLKLPTQAKLEVARNYWDEMGRGQEKGMHGPMLDRLAVELEISDTPFEEIVPESLALGNILLGLAVNREFAFHSIGALGAVELTAPVRAQKVHKGLSRLGLSPEAQRYFSLHATLDVRHSNAWNKEVIEPLVRDRPELTRPIAEGALMRLNAGARCFERYREEFGL